MDPLVLLLIVLIVILGGGLTAGALHATGLVPILLLVIVIVLIVRLAGNRTLLAIAVLAVAWPASAQTPAVPEPEPHAAIFHAAIVAAVALHGADSMQTAYLIGSQRGREANPVLAPISGHPLAFGAVKMGLAAGTNWAIIKMHRSPKWRWLAAGLLALEIGAESYAVIHNNKLLPETAQ